MCPDLMSVFFGRGTDTDEHAIAVAIIVADKAILNTKLAHRMEALP